MDVNFHHTIAAPSGGKGKPAGTPEGNGNGVFAQTLDGNFFDILFNRINTQNTETTGISGDTAQGESLTESALTLDNATDPLSADSIDAESLLDTATEEGTGEITNPEILADGATRMEETKRENMSAAELKQFKTALESLLQGIPAENRPSVMNISPGQLKKALENLNIDLSEIDTEDGSLIAAGLDPAALAELQEKLMSGTEVSMVSLTNTQNAGADNAEGALLLNSTIIIPKGANQNIAGASGDGLDARDIMDAIKAALQGSKGNTPLHEYRANNILQNTGANGDAAATSPTAGNSTFPALNAPGLSNLFSSAAWDSIFPEGLDWAQGSGVHPALSHSAQAASLTSLVSHAPQAGQPHPASQIVAATITKTASEGENKNITLKLNPPELGRVEIRMEFGDDKKVKANIVIEKPETHLMLQRDSHMLERALQEAGLDVDGSSLNFELAQDGSLFDQDGNNNSGSNASGGSNGGADNGEGEEIIEATMDWYVDPETGLTRYDLLA